MSSLPSNIKALQIQSDHTVKVVEIPFSSQEEIRNLAGDHIVLRVRAVGLNPTDWKHALTPLGGPDVICGCDASGDVVRVGSEVKHLEIGDRVAGLTSGSHQKDNGAYAEYVRFEAASTFKMPDDMSYEEGASFPVPHLTAAQALYHCLALPYPSSPPSAEKAILIWGGSTAVGHHAYQLAKISGYKVYVTASPAVHSELKSGKLGADEVFDYKDADVVKKIQGKDANISAALDNVAEHGTTDIVVDALSPSQGGKVITLLFPTEETKTRRKDVHVDPVLAYTLQGKAFTFMHRLKIPAKPEDKAFALKYVSEEMPGLLEGWKEGVGSERSGLRPQKLRKMPGGLEKIEEGLKIMKEGAYGREKLVYTIA